MTNTQNEPVEVTQADRDVMADAFRDAFNWDESELAAIRRGDRDDRVVVQAFAKHRLSASSAVVDALREAEQIADTPGAGLISEESALRELGLLYNHRDDDSPQFTRWQMVVAMSHGAALANTPKQSAGLVEETYLVWSNEHRAWWRPNGRGYTIKLEAAGRYTREEAIDIAGGRLGWIKDREPDEIPVLERDALDAAKGILAALEGDRP